MGEATESPATSSATSPLGVACRSGGVRTAPTISSAISRAERSRGVQVATTLPRRRIVASSQSARISSSLWLM